MRYQSGKWLLTTFLIGALAACAPAAPAAPTAAPAAPTAAPEPTAAPTAAPAEPTATMAPAAPAMSGKIKIATQSPLSGPQAALGTGIRNGADLGLQDMGKMLTDMGFEVELAPFDDQAKPEVGAANAKNIASDPDILCIVGHLNSGVALASLPTYKDNSLAMVSPANTNPKITESGYQNAFRVVGRDDVQGAVGEEFARTEMQIKSVYIIHDKTDYGQGVAEFFRQQAEKNGIQVLGFEGTEEKSNFESILTPIQAANPDLIYFGGIYDQAGPLFRQARDRGITAKFLGPDGLDSPELLKLAGDAVKGMYYTSVAAPVSQFPDAAKFAEDYKAKFNEDAPPFSAQAYDAMGICIRAIAQAAEKAGGKPSREQVVQAIRDAGEYKGITGAYTFNAKGDPVTSTYFVLQVSDKDGEPGEVWNANAVVKKLDIPAP
ncbi:MAG: branched-chain amino acid ABC transporter substrate-binding protein [Candidatus Thermofonsia Clade 3 bacterium]|uniref:Branched-chain amino acid ABC transporter substrate-binding protein n=1 Tax=Candidatus Thermofonsia Clade 3 bacterium TaxID=2364212 RepID=A0A2M8QH00_9CHLR|nr:branched-chain amino acid ABC transporter substrate-binding protein [Candidatus Roseilinea sp. NK_OTU-006]PJF49022.1 MAG: branched-chain amino acid ABC transporter substrate-binding protein [Candidatus Thermofonsia Clade 3 bacterium]